MKKFSDFNNNLTDQFYRLNIGRKMKLIGSSNQRAILYNSDYDLESHFEVKGEAVLQKIYEHFKQVFKEAKKDPNIFLTDFKCGEKKGMPIRWTYSDMMKGKKAGLSFIDCLKQKSTIKLDEIYLLNGSFVEISDNYYFTGAIQNVIPQTRKEIEKSLKEDYLQLVKNKNYYKALKRAYSIKKVPKILDYFNSVIGLMNKSRADLDVLLLLNEQKFRTPKLTDINNDLQIIKQDLSYSPLDLSDLLDQATKRKNRRVKFQLIQQVRDKVFDYINKDAKMKYF
jgi:hypothetical protein